MVPDGGTDEVDDSKQLRCGFIYSLLLFVLGVLIASPPFMFFGLLRGLRTFFGFFGPRRLTVRSEWTPKSLRPRKKGFKRVLITVTDIK